MQIVKNLKKTNTNDKDKFNASSTITHLNTLTKMNELTNTIKNLELENMRLKKTVNTYKSKENQNISKNSTKCKSLETKLT